MFTPRPSELIRSALALLICMTAPTLAVAQAPVPSGAPSAQALFDEAIAELKAKSYTSACPKLLAVTEQLPNALGAKKALAECYEGQGKLASAWWQYMLLKTIAGEAGKSGHSKSASNKADALKPRLATLTIEVPAAVRSTKGLIITRDGKPTSEAQWSTALPVDVGTHEVIVTAPGRKTWTGRVEFSVDGTQASIQVKPLEPEQSPVPTPLHRSNDSSVERTPMYGSTQRLPPHMPSVAKSGWQKPIGAAAIGLGIAGAMVGGILGMMAIEKNMESNANNHCIARSDICKDQTGVDIRSVAVDLGNSSTGAFIGGAAVLAGGIAIFATAPRVEAKNGHSGSGRSSWRAGVEVGPSGIVFKGGW